MIEVTINSKSCQIDAETSIEELLDKFEIAREGTAVAVNSTVIPRSKHAGFKLKGGDALEIIRAIGGG